MKTKVAMLAFSLAAAALAGCSAGEISAPEKSAMRLAAGPGAVDAGVHAYSIVEQDRRYSLQLLGAEGATVGTVEIIFDRGLVHLTTRLAGDPRALEVVVQGQEMEAAFDGNALPQPGGDTAGRTIPAELRDAANPYMTILGAVVNDEAIVNRVLIPNHVSPRCQDWNCCPWWVTLGSCTLGQYWLCGACIICDVVDCDGYPG